MKNMRKVGLLVVTALLGFGAVGISAPAQADTTWGCPTCLQGGR
jgi:hypothetical protein